MDKRISAKFLRRLIVLAVPLAVTAPAAGQQLLTVPLPLERVTAPFSLVPEKRTIRPRVGLALSGGGLRGICQLAVLQVLSENNIPIDYISGTSVGSLVGGLYAAGYAPDELWAIIRDLNLADLLRDTPSRSNQFLAIKQRQSRAIVQLRLEGGKFFLPEAITPGHNLTTTLTDLLLNAPLHEVDFNRLRVPLKIIATDLISGKKIVLQRGNLIEAMRSSVAVPLLLLPVEYDDYLLVDGGLSDNLPVEETRAFGADIVLAVDCTANLRDREEMRAPWELADQVTTIMQQEHNRKQLEKADLVLSFRDYAAALNHSGEIVKMYQEAQRRTREIIPQLRAMLETKKAAMAPAAVRAYRCQKVAFISSLQLGFSELIPSRAGGSCTLAGIQSDLATLFDTGYFDQLEARIQLSGADTTLVYALTPYSRLNDILFYGNSAISDSLLKLPFASLLGRPLNRHMARTALEEVIRQYRRHGYSLAEYGQISFNEQTGVAHIHINEGRIADLHFEGNATTRRHVLEREFTLKRGDLFQLDQARSAVNNLYGTGLFDAVTLLPNPTPDGWELIIRLIEKKFTILRMGSRYDLERNGRFFIELADENLLGTSNDLTLHGQYGDRDHRLALQFNANRIFKSYLTNQVIIKREYARRYQYENFRGVGEYERRVSGAYVSLGTQIARLGVLSGFMRLEKINITGLSGAGYDPGDLVVNTFGITTVVDTRDRVPFPTTGKYNSFSYEVSAGQFPGAEVSYFKVQNQLTTYWTWRERSTFSPRLIWGTSDLTTPFSEQYKIGGESSFYGLRDEEWQGRNLIIGSLEYRYTLPWKNYLTIYLSTRYDFGAVWKNSIEVKGSDFISGRGAALAVKTPVGPIAIACGRSSVGKTRLYFTAGYDF